ncbi:MAG: single-stranded-DNA-specific exonuclease RecJ [Rhodospirillales bacterium]|nr:single-stranded-DNA-specific exonuclease RecJ [Rhodospirillales bacterium]
MLAPPPFAWTQRPSPPASTVAETLGVERSLTGRNWTLAPADDRLAMALAQRLDLPEIVARLLAVRGIGLDAAASFLDPRLRDLLPDPCRLEDMRRGSERLAAAITAGERIAIYGDYDVDGATAAAVLLRFLRAVGAEPLLYVPDRLREGYGPNAPALRALANQGVGLVVTVDCGIAAHDALAAAASAGLDVIVVDHHQASLPLPPAVAVINPKRPDDASGLDHLCAAGVAFLLMVDTNRLLRAAGRYSTRPEPDLRQWLDLVALGTVCDVVPLAGVNRAFVAQGLKVMAGRGNAGLRAIADLAGLRGPASARDLGFAIGPRINAGGRVGQADLGARLLACDDPVEAARLAQRLNALNRERQEIEQGVWAAATARLGVDADGAPLLWAVGEGWHPGVIGIVASRLAERFRRPALVVAIDSERAVASGRSVRGRDLGAAVNAAVAEGLLVKGGGHAMAAGFTAEPRRLTELRAFLEARLAVDAVTAEGLRSLSIDGVLSLAGAAALPPAFLARLAPFGAGHAEPRFMLQAVRIAYTRPAGSAHLACGLIDGGTRLPAIAFRCLDQPLGQALAAHAGAPFHLAGRLQQRRGAGAALQLIIDDAAPALRG